MRFSDIIGQQHIKNHLMYSAKNGRIPHAQLFIAPEGVGALPMAIAYAQYIICQNNLNDNEGGNESCNLKFDNYQHPDLHFVFPVYSNKTEKKYSSEDFLPLWYDFIKMNPYGSYTDWLHKMEVKNQQPQISVKEAEFISRKLALKAYEGSYKVMIVWMAEKMNVDTANKLLKLLEEPYEKTLFLLIAEDEKSILPTILSRCQVLHFNKLADQDIAHALIEKENVEENRSKAIAKLANGNYNKALKEVQSTEEGLPFDKWFVDWVRSAFRANKDAKVVSNLVSWSDELSTIGRENQKLFLEHCLEIFRQALLLNYGAKDLVYYQSKVDSFKLENFAPFINDQNIFEIYKEINNSIYHIERNANPKILFTDLSIKLTRLIHRK